MDKNNQKSVGICVICGEKNTGKLHLFPCFGNVSQGFGTFPGDISPVSGRYFIFREQFGPHAYAECACLEPRCQILPRRFHPTGHHQLGPWHRSHQAFYKIRTIYISRKYLAKITAGLLRKAHFRNRTASRCICNQPAIAYLSNRRIE